MIDAPMYKLQNDRRWPNKQRWPIKQYRINCKNWEVRVFLMCLKFWFMLSGVVLSDEVSSIGLTIHLIDVRRSRLQSRENPPE